VQVKIEETGPCSRTMLVEASWDEVKDDYGDVVKGLARVNVPGFRPGKAPRAIIEQRFATDILEEVRDRCARRLGRQAMDENEISMVGIAEVSDMEFLKGKGYTFKVEFDVIPEFTLPAYSGLSLSKDADQDALRDEISRFLLENTQLELPSSFVDGEMEGEGVGEGDPGYEEAREAAEARVKLMIILKRIARDDGIEVDDRDMDERVAGIAEAEGTTPKLLRNELAAKGGLGRLRDFLLAEMVFDYILENRGRSGPT